MSEELTGGKRLRDSKTVINNALSIVAAIGTIASIFAAGSPDPSVTISVVTTALTSIYGNVMSIIYRKKATEKIAPNTDT